MASSRLHIALVGCGRIGFLLENDPLRYKPCTHYGGAVSAGFTFTHACDINRGRLVRFGNAAVIPGDNLFADYRELLKQARPRVVVIATWTDSHEKIAVEAARNGAAVIVLEKPMAPRLSGCRSIIDECRRHGTTVIINHERRYDSRYRKVKEIIARGKIGEIKTVHASILTGGYRGKSDAAEGGGPLLQDGTHLVDMIRYLFGEITLVEGEFQRGGRSRGFEDRACAWLKTGSGADVFLEAGGGRNYFVFELEISGTLGKIIIGNGYESLLIHKTSRLYTGFRDIVPVKFPAFRKNNCFTALYREARKALAGDAAITSSAGDGYRALEVIHAVYLSSHMGRKPIPLPLDPGSVDLEKIFNLK
jgi:predicted dehydrogenase